MANTSRLRIAYLSYLSSPISDRLIYRTICRQKARRILELGIAIGQRGVRMIEGAKRFHPEREVFYCGLDPFEGRSAVDGPGVTLKMAHRLLSATGAQIRLIPGDPCLGLAGIANDLGQVDVVVISPRLDLRRLGQAWLYVPRLLHARSEVLLERILPGGKTSVRLLPRGEIEALASAARGRRVA